MAEQTSQTSFSLTAEGVPRCPECDAVIELTENVMDGEIVDCPDCRFEMEVVFDPSTVNLADIARRVPKGEPPYDTSKLNLAISPTVVPVETVSALFSINC